MDATLATGAAAMMAIRVLLDHSVEEENIILVALLMAEQGVHNVAYAFPKVKIVTTAVDPELNEMCYILPGIGKYILSIFRFKFDLIYSFFKGNFGDRYFGTEKNECFFSSLN